MLVAQYSQWGDVRRERFDLFSTSMSRLLMLSVFPFGVCSRVLQVHVP